MKKANKEAVSIARHMGTFLRGYAPVHITESSNTLKSYETALSLYLDFLEENSVSSTDLCWDYFSRQWIERWLAWLKENRGCKNAFGNARFADGNWQERPCFYDTVVCCRHKDQ